MNFIEKAHFKQADEVSCVPASLAMVLSVYDKEVSQAELKDYMGTTESGIQVEVAWESLPFERWNLQYYQRLGCSLEDLENELAKGVPPIVFIVSSFLPHSEGDFLHAVVVVGLNRESIYINDPLLEESSPFEMELSIFQAAWQWYNYCMISVFPAQEK